jgi:hypothetical protein
MRDPRSQRGEEGKPPTAMLALQCYRCCCRNEQSGQQHNSIPGLEQREQDRAGKEGHPRSTGCDSKAAGMGDALEIWGRTLEDLVFCFLARQKLILLALYATVRLGR